jgi:uncharacterized membrane protein YidH (DUF202 family)
LASRSPLGFAALRRFRSFRMYSWRGLPRNRRDRTDEIALLGIGESLEKKATGMTNPSDGTIRGRFEVRATASDHFSWLRTRLSVERTMMSWVRTAVSLIGFGFTIVQFFERMQDLPGIAPAHFPDAPRYLGLTLILCGIASLVISVWERRFCGSRGNYKGGQANTTFRSCNRAHSHRLVRFLFRTVSSVVAVRAE